MQILFTADGEVTGDKDSNDAAIFLVDDKSAPASKNFARLLDSDKNFSGKTGQSLTFPFGIVLKKEGSNYKKGILVGVGSLDGLNTLAAEAIGSKIAGVVKGSGFGRVSISTELLSGPVDPKILADVANGALLKSYTFDKYKTTEKKPEPALVFTDNVAPFFEKHRAVAAGAFLARDLANEPPNVINPVTLTERIFDELRPLGITIRVLDEKDLQKMGAGAILAVGMGSKTPPRIVMMEYDGTRGRTKDWPLALVGKGLTFDTGGISLKPDGGKGMKFDMCGAAAVIGAIKALAERGANTKVVGVVGLAENAIGSGAYRNDDVLKPLGKKTVEINNTDAEGRLVLIDCLTYVQNEYKPKTVIDLATLTGACLMALGHTYAGVMSNDDALFKKIDKAGAAVNELTWRLPLHAHFTAAMKGTTADLKNTGGREAGASTAAAFIQEYIQDGVKWAHIDIAGMADGVNGHPTMPDGIGTGYGVRLLDRYIANEFEKPALVAKPVSAHPAP